MLPHRLRTFRDALGRIGAVNTLRYIWLTKVVARLFSLRKGGSKYRLGKLDSKGLHYPLYFRYNSSDACVFSQIFILNEYSGIRITHADLIIDCGANVGYSSAYFLSRFPDASVIAIEPDPRNFELLRMNLGSYGDRVRIIESAIWTDSVGLKINAHPTGDSMEWATTVTEALDGEVPDISAIDIGRILAESGKASIDILKMDIEGAEEEVFQRNYKNWLGNTNVIAIELHGQQRRRIFERTLADYPFESERSGELTIAQRSA